jgi:uncharacterized membrane protein YoaK (UPF0700 family)
MFSYQGHQRTHGHNLQLATLFSFVAGYVNVVGFLAVSRLTTNVTGHFAHLIHDAFVLDYSVGLTFLGFIFTFFVGSFTSSVLVELVRRKSDKNIFILPVVLESAILLFVAIFGQTLAARSPDSIAMLLLFAMGLQNSLVTKISSAIVRTTHLTGLFTDLGIELSQLIFYRAEKAQRVLRKTIELRFRIIIFFFIGGIAGAFAHQWWALQALVLPATLLVLELVYDSLRFTMRNLRRSKPEIE